jgi:hypothetical protein
MPRDLFKAWPFPARWRLMRAVSALSVMGTLWIEAFDFIGAKNLLDV